MVISSCIKYEHIGPILSKQLYFTKYITMQSKTIKYAINTFGHEKISQIF